MKRLTTGLKYTTNPKRRLRMKKGHEADLEDVKKRKRKKIRHGSWDDRRIHKIPSPTYIDSSRKNFS